MGAAPAETPRWLFLPAKLGALLLAIAKQVGGLSMLVHSPSHAQPWHPGASLGRRQKVR